jgi:class 3 adenylate cyclase
VIDADRQSASRRPHHAVQPAYQARERLRTVLLIAALIAGTALLLWLGQPAAAALLPLTGLLLEAVIRRDRRARALAHWITVGQFDQKIEVRRGSWGDLDRAVNGLMQAQRVQQRLRAVLPEPLPQEAVRALLSGGLATRGAPRTAAVLLASCAGRAAGDRERGQRAALVAWRALAQEAQEQAQRHNALLQPCGDGIMIAFGAFAEQPAGESLRAALLAAEALGRNWRDGGINAGGPLVLSIAAGPALAAALPGLGYCLLGAPVDEAVQLQQLAIQSQQYGLVCGEGVYYVLRKANSAGWQPTDLRIPAPNRPAQVVYTRLES